MKAQDKNPNIAVDYLIPIIFGIGILVILSFYKLYFGLGLMESDSASDICYAYLLGEEGSVISKNYYFSTALRFFDNELLFAALFRMFPGLGWWEIENIGTMLMNGLVAAASVFLAYQLGLGKRSLWLFGLSLLPYGGSQFYYALMHGCGYYSYAVFQVYLILALFFGIVSDRKQNKFLLWTEWCLFLGLSVLSGIQGVRLLENLYLPLLLCSAGLWLYDFWKRAEQGEVGGTASGRGCGAFIPGGYFRGALAGFMMALAGYAVNRLLLRGVFTWSDMENLKWKEFSFAPVEAFIKDILYNLGYWNNLPLLSKRGLINPFSILLCMVVICILLSACREKTAEKQDFLAYFFITAMLVHLLIYLFLMNMYRARYMLPFFMCLPHVVFASGAKWKKGSRRAVFTLLGICITLNSLNVMATTRERCAGREAEAGRQKEMADFLTANHYTYGFSTFEFGNSTIQLSDGKLEVCHLKSLAAFEKYQWLCSKKEVDYQWTEETFLIVSDKQLKEFEDMAWNQEEKVIWHEGGICVFSFGSVIELQNAFVSRVSR